MQPHAFFAAGGVWRQGLLISWRDVCGCEPVLRTGLLRGSIVLLVDCSVQGPWAQNRGSVGRPWWTIERKGLWISQAGVILLVVSQVDWEGLDGPPEGHGVRFRVWGSQVIPALDWLFLVPAVVMKIGGGGGGLKGPVVGFDDGASVWRFPWYRSGSAGMTLAELLEIL